MPNDLNDKIPLSFTAAVLSGEVRARLPMTAKCINSINAQSYTKIQKILVNGGSPPHQTQDLINMGVDLRDWQIIDFPVDAMDVDNNWNRHRWNGLAALNAAMGDFFFALNDDDFLASNFFERIASLLNQYPIANAAMGMKVYYNHETKIFGKVNRIFNSKGVERPNIEPGIDVVREIFFKNNLSYGPGLGFQPVCRTSLIREAGPKFFNEGFYPDCSPYFQVVARTHMVFDREALMYWGLHGQQDHGTWDAKNYWLVEHEKVFNIFSRNNFEIFMKFLPANINDGKNIKKYFKKRIISYSLFAISTHYSVFKLFKPTNNNIRREISKYDKHFPVFKHLAIILKRPIVSMEIILKNLKNLLR